MKLTKKIEFSKEQAYTFRRYQPIFETVDGKIHDGAPFDYVAEESLWCSVWDYLRMSIREAGGINASDGAYFPIENMIKIEWKLIDSQTVNTTLEPCLSINEFFTQEELESFGKIEMPK